MGVCVEFIECFFKFFDVDVVLIVCELGLIGVSGDFIFLVMVVCVLIG